MGKVGFVRLTSNELYSTSKFSDSGVKVKEGYEMLVNNLIQAGASRDPSHLFVPPYVIFRPVSVKQLKLIVKISQQFKIPVTFASGKTGLSGGYVNYAILVELESLRTLKHPFEINLKKKTLKVDQVVLVSDLIKGIPYFSNNELIFPVQPTSAIRLPVRVGGLISSNASGVTSGKLGAAEDWILKLNIMTPTGKIIRVNRGDVLFKKVVGGTGYYGVVLNAVFKLYKPAKDPKRYVLIGKSLTLVSERLQLILNKKIYPLVSEFALSSLDLSSKFPSIQDLVPSDKKFNWIILLKGSDSDTNKFVREISNQPDITVIELTEEVFQKCLQDRSAIPASSISIGESEHYLRFPGFEDILIQPKDIPETINTINSLLKFHDFNEILIANAHINFRKGKGFLLHVRLPVPLTWVMEIELYATRISEMIYDAIMTLKENFDIKYKAEHSAGPFLIWLDPKFRIQLRVGIFSKKAFYNPQLSVFEQIMKELYDLSELSRNEIYQYESELSKGKKKEIFINGLSLYFLGK